MSEMNNSPDSFHHGRFRRNAWLLLLPLCALALLVWQPRQGNAEPPPELKKLHDAVATEKYNDARQLANKLLRTGNPAIRAQVARPLGRILLATGDTEGVESYFKMLKQAKLDTGAQELVDVYKLWALALDGKTDEAVEGLQEIVDKDRPTYGALEAGDILAILHLQQGNREEAQKLVDSRLQLIKYNDVEDPYIERLLKGRMSSKWFAGGGEAERLYSEAEGLRKNENFAEAGKLYARVQSQFSESPFADASGFRIGQCFLGLNQSRRAESHWREFLNDEPEGPWRGQTYLALANVALLERLDVDSASEQLQSAVQAYEQGVGDKALLSWQQAAKNFYLQLGVIALAERRYDDAGDALDKANRVPGGSNARFVALTQQLRTIASERQNVLPAELDAGDRDIQTATALGVLSILMDRHTDARKIFSALLNGSRATRSAPHRSFIALGLARLFLRSDEREQAKKGYQYSLSQHPKGEWRDQTLRELALLIERKAAEQYPAPENTKTKSGLKRAPSDEQKKLQRSQLYAARAEALPYWVDLYRNHPESGFVPQSLFHMGQLYVEAGRIDWAAKSFEKLTQEYPHSRWTGDAHVWLIDVNLEREFDLEAAREHAREAQQWLAKRDPNAADEQFDTTLFAETANLRTARAVTYDITVRAGLIEYLDGQYSTAAQRFREARRFSPPRRYRLVMGSIATGTERLIKAASAGESITPEEVKEGDSKAKLMLMLADLYYEGRQFEQALELCERVIKGEAPQATPNQQSWAYFKKGRNLHAMFLPLDAVPEFQRAAQVGPDAPWCPTALSYAANGIFNYTQDVPNVVARWKRLAARFPESEEAERATYHIGFAFEKSGRFREAKAAYEHFIDTYPNSDYVRAIRRFHLPVVEKNLSNPTTP